MKVDVFITTEIFNRDGKLRYKRKRKSKSFVKAFLAILLTQMQPGVDVTNIIDYAGGSCDIEDNVLSFKCDAVVNTGIFGVLAGTGTTAVTASDYRLESYITEGTGAGQFSYSAMFFTALSVSDPNVSFTLYRDFTNSSGATITVNEEGIVVYAHADKDGVVKTYSFCIIRDVETTGVEVEDGECLRVTYTIKTST